MRSFTDQKIDRPTQLVDQLAVFLRNRTIYPPGHGRVQASAEGLHELLVGSGGRVVPTTIVVMGQRVTVDGEPVPLGGTHGGWLRGHFRRLRLGGIRIHADATVADLRAFADRFAARVAAPDPSGAWHDDGAPLARVEPLDLRIRGRHGADVGDGPDFDGGAADVYERIAANDEARARLASLQRALDHAHDDGEPRSALDLLPQILDVALADVAVDEARALPIVCRVLETLERRVGDPDAVDLGGGSGDAEFAALAEVAQNVARTFFGRPTTALEPYDEELPVGRPEDAQITDDLALLLEEIDALPGDGPAPVFEPARQIRAHVEAILLHVCERGSRPELRARAAFRLAAAYRDDGVDPAPRFECVLREGAAAARRHVARALLDAGLLEVLARCPSLDPAWLADGFPRSFAELLEGGASGERLATDALRAALRAVPPRTLVDGLRTLAADSDRRVRLATLLATCVADAADAFGWLAQDPDPTCRQLVIQALRAVDLPPAEGAALQTVPASMLDGDYLRALCLAKTSEQAARHARQGCERLLRRFVDDCAGDATRHPARLAAVKALALHPTAATRTFLDRLGRGSWFAGRMEREVRTAARLSRRTIGG